MHGVVVRTGPAKAVLLVVRQYIAASVCFAGVLFRFTCCGLIMCLCGAAALVAVVAGVVVSMF